ncbi:MAG: ABC transporter permease [Pseudomonadota bacterium]
MSDTALAAAAPGPGRRRLVDGTVLVLALLLIWQGLHLLAGDVAVTAPLPTLAHLGDLLASPTFWPHVAETTSALLWALVISLFGGLVVGTALGGHRLSGEVAEPILVALYSLPKITLYPVVLLLFGLGIEAKIAFGALHGIIPVTIFAMNAVRNVRPVYLRSARAMRLGPWQTATRVLVPATVPEIVTGFRIGFALTMLGVLIGELFASQRGLGFLLLKAMERNDVLTILALAVLLFTFATAVSLALLWLDKRLHHRT